MSFYFSIALNLKIFLLFNDAYSNKFDQYMFYNKLCEKLLAGRLPSLAAWEIFQ